MNVALRLELWRIGYGLLAGAACALILMPMVMWFAHRVGAVDHGGHRKINQRPIPLLGGLTIALPVLAMGLVAALGGMAMIVWWKEAYRLAPTWFSPLMEVAAMRRDILAITIGGAAIVLIGMVDDIRGMKARVKLLGQIAVAAFIFFSGFRVSSVNLPLLGAFVFDDSASFFFTILWITGLINAFNLIDGLDGLAAGIGAIAAATLGVLAWLNGALIASVGCAFLTGALLAFLVFNFNPARIFLGDTGSMFLGYILATLTIMGSYKTEAATIIIAPLIGLSLPIFETFLSMLRRYVRGAPIFAGDRGHTHHRLLDKGYSQRQVVLILYGLTLVLSAAAVAGQLLPPESPYSVGPLAGAALAFLAILYLAGYLCPASFRAVLRRRRSNNVLKALGQYAVASLSHRGLSGGAAGHPVLDVCRHEMNLAFLEVWNEDEKARLAVSGRPPEPPPGASLPDVEKVRLKSAYGHRLAARYCFRCEPSDIERQDVAACLANIFEFAALTPNNIIELAEPKKPLASEQAKTL